MIHNNISDFKRLKSYMYQTLMVHRQEVHKLVYRTVTEQYPEVLLI
jgi:hypothetical protein